VVVASSVADSFVNVAGPGIADALTSAGLNNSGVSLFAVEVIHTLDVTTTTPVVIADTHPVVITEALDKAALVGIIVGVVATVGIVAVLCYYCYTQNQGVTVPAGLAMQTSVYHIGDDVSSEPQIHYNAFACEEHPVYANIPPNDRFLYQYPVYANIPHNYGGLHHVPGVVHQTHIPMYCTYREGMYYHPSEYQ
jgi:hypothetical protein